ncbi:helix-turn-helix domain-containing protein [Paenibacillus sp. Cedars]|uniref:helix-turn-helix domain-containing protein n=1 Tax=Paenibacillus sp. Cedars TaxID=1980674 RepID=UPI001163B4B8|nr:hypothetical protein B9D94_19945 [Paenibacillus sp. Cedars]
MEGSPEILTPADIQKVLDIGINQTYNLIKENRFHHVRVGRKMLVPKNSFIDWLEGVIHR